MNSSNSSNYDQSNNNNNNNLWSTTEDFGQKVDLTVRIREILRNYPQGLAILKELIQNADDAGARSIKFCLTKSSSSSSSSSTNNNVNNNNNDTNNNNKLQKLTECPSLLVYNSAKFTDSDFESLQNIGSSLKNSINKAKTGRFGLGFNSVYHLTDVPMFLSGCSSSKNKKKLFSGLTTMGMKSHAASSKLVVFDPMCEYIPNMDPRNPGKIIDISGHGGQELLRSSSLWGLFEPFEVFGCKLRAENEDDNVGIEGTLFRFALRSEELATTSRLSPKAHTFDQMKSLLQHLSEDSANMLLFLKNIEELEIYIRESVIDSPVLVHRSSIESSQNLRNLRSAILSKQLLDSEKVLSVDYSLFFKTTCLWAGNESDYDSCEEWIVCNQFGGHQASLMSSDPEFAHMNLVPWAGVATKIVSTNNDETSRIKGKAYCFLPLPINTNLPIHVNGYFELSSNRRDIWWGADDMDGDGRARALWNEALISDIIAPSYCRLIAQVIKTEKLSKDIYEYYLPTSASLSGPWEILSQQFYQNVLRQQLPVLYSEAKSMWVNPSKSVVLPDRNLISGMSGQDLEMLGTVLRMEKSLNLVIFQNSDVHKTLLQYSVYGQLATPSFARKYFSSVLPAEQKHKYALFLLKYCISDLSPSQYYKISGCHLLPLADGTLARFERLEKVNNDNLQQLMAMGFSCLSSSTALREHKNDFQSSLEYLVEKKYSFDAPRGPYIVCESSRELFLFEENLTHKAVNVTAIVDRGVLNFFKNIQVHDNLNVAPFRLSLLPDILQTIVRKKQAGGKEVRNPHLIDASKTNSYLDPTKSPPMEWFCKLWIFLGMNQEEIFKDPSLKSFVLNAKLVPSAASTSLKCLAELYDPDVSYFVELLDMDSFPHESLHDARVMSVLRSMGLQQNLTIDLVIDCAKQIQNLASHHDLEMKESASNRSKELLLFFDSPAGSDLLKLPSTKKKKSIFSRVNSVLFESSKKDENDEMFRSQVKMLMNLKWVPVLTQPPESHLPWQDCFNVSPVASPTTVTLSTNRWLVSYSLRLLDAEIKSKELLDLFGWSNPVKCREVCGQLKAIVQMSYEAESKNSEKIRFKSVISSEIQRIYRFLDQCNSEYESEIIRNELGGLKWLWMGNRFVSAEYVAFESVNINAEPYLHVLPSDTRCFGNLVKILGIRSRFDLSDYVDVLNRIAKEQDENNSITTHQIDLSVNLVQSISDDVMRVKDYNIYAPNCNGKLLPAVTMVYDDAPWMSKTKETVQDLIFLHEKISLNVAERIGSKSLRLSMFEGSIDNQLFGDGVQHESFGQSESLTRRLKNIIELYPEGAQQLSELIQNADDANASIVKIVINHKSYGTSSLLGPTMSAWQGPSLMVYNDSKFSPEDFHNLRKIGQASKLDKLATTGRFGLGFNSVFHWTDLPSIVSGDYLVYFDPHEKYVPGNNSRGVKIKFSGTNLNDNFNDQMQPYQLFGCDMKKSFDGTLFRFPFRTEETAKVSEISKVVGGTSSKISDLVKKFYDVLYKYLIFLKNVKCIELYQLLEDSDTPELLYSTRIRKKTPIYFNIRTNEVSFGQEPRESVFQYVSGTKERPLSKEALYAKLRPCPEHNLPQNTHRLEIEVEDFRGMQGTPKGFVDQYLVHTGLGGRECKKIACDPSYRHMKLLPYGAVAAHLFRSGGTDDALISTGGAFCFLPLPVKTGLPVHINGYFELSSNRRDIWQGEDMAGESSIRSMWNRLLLRDVLAPLYAQLLLIASRTVVVGHDYYSLWPNHEVSADIWKTLRDELYKNIMKYDCLFTKLSGGFWVRPEKALLASESQSKESYDSSRLAKLLLEQNQPVVLLPKNIVSLLVSNNTESVTTAEPSFVRKVFKSRAEMEHKLNRDDVLFLLEFCVSDLSPGSYNQLIGLPFLPLVDSKYGIIGRTPSRMISSSHKSFLVPNNMSEYELLKPLSSCLVDTNTESEVLNSLFKDQKFQLEVGLSKLNFHNFIECLTMLYPVEFQDLIDIRWNPEEFLMPSGVRSKSWIAHLWKYITSDVNESEMAQRMSLLFNSVQIVPCRTVGEERILMMLQEPLAILNPFINSKQMVSNEVLNSLREIGLRVLDVETLASQGDIELVINALSLYVKGASVEGFLEALFESLPSDIDGEIFNRRIGLKFTHLSSVQKELLFNFVRDGLNLVTDLKESSRKVLHALPIYPVYNDNFDISTEEKKYGSLVDYKYLPPDGVDKTLLDSSFLVHPEDGNGLIRLLDLKKMKYSHFYEHYICPKITEAEDCKKYDSALCEMMMSLPRFASSADSNWLRRMSAIPFLTTEEGNLDSPQNLYDPNVPFSAVLDNDMIPKGRFCRADLLVSLRMLGLRTILTTDDILKCCRKVEMLSHKQNDEDRALAGKRGRAIMKYLDDDDIFSELVSSFFVDGRESQDKSTELLISEVLRDPNNIGEDIEPLRSFLKSLCEIAWVPILIKNGGNNIDEIDHVVPPTKDHENPSFLPPLVAAPRSVRLPADTWICSKSMDIVALPARSQLFMKGMGWLEKLSPEIIAKQIVALSYHFDESGSDARLRQKMSEVLPRCYRLLDEGLENSHKGPTISSILNGHSWIWVGEKFVNSEQVAFEAPDNARPYLFSLPSEMKTFERILSVCQVRDNFYPEDYIKVTSDLRAVVPLTSRHQELACGMAKLISRFPDETLAEIEKNNIFLPTGDGEVYPAPTMTFDDAPWLTSRISKAKLRNFRFVDLDIGETAAKRLGCRSLRDVLSARQNGMVTIPCPKKDTLTQFYSSNKQNNPSIASFDDLKVFLDMLEVAEMNKVKRVSIMYDERCFEGESLVHPLLASTQGPSINVCFHEVSLDIEDILKLVSPSTFYINRSKRAVGGGGVGFPRAGKGLCGLFHLTKCAQILSGNQLLFFDPAGEFFFDGSSSTENIKESSLLNKKAVARRYLISSQFAEQFGDTFSVFESLPFGVKEAFSNSDSGKNEAIFSGTIFRMPIIFDHSSVTSRKLDHSGLESIMMRLQEKMSSCFLFTYHLQNINLLRWREGETQQETMKQVSVYSSPLNRRSHHDELTRNPEWKRTQKISKLFQGSWKPIRKSQFIEIKSYDGSDGKDIIDTFIVHSVLAPNRIRKLLKAESLSTLEILPLLSLASHIGRKVDDDDDKISFKGSIFIGFDSCNSTGLPFHVNAPFFLNELDGKLTLDKESEDKVKALVPKIREVRLPNGETKTFNSYIWNSELMHSVMQDVVPSLLEELKEYYHYQYSNRICFYNYWPSHVTMNPLYKSYLVRGFFEALSAKEFWLTDEGQFKCITEGIFVDTKECVIKENLLLYLKERVQLFTVPPTIVGDLKTFQITAKELTPRSVRALLKKNDSFISYASQRPDFALDMLEYCLSDLAMNDIASPNSQAVYKDLNGLCLMPLADGSVGTFGRQMIIANAEQQYLLPCLKSKFVSSTAFKKLGYLLENNTVLGFLKISLFDPKVLADSVDNVLPSNWKGKDFVPWSPGTNNEPTRLWLNLFWKYVKIDEPANLNLFRSWPLIPTKSKELASCANIRYLLVLSIDLKDNDEATYLSNEMEVFTVMRNEEEKKGVLLQAAEARLKSDLDARSGSRRLFELEDCSVQDDHSVHSYTSAELSDVNETRHDEDTEDRSNTSTETSNNGTLDSNTGDVQPEQSSSLVSAALSTRCVSSFQTILDSLRSPLIEQAFFESSRLSYFLPVDYLALVRSVLVTISQTENYWDKFKDYGQTNDVERLQWDSINRENLLEMFFSPDGNRVSLMPSDLSLIKRLPVFETLANDWVSLDRVDGFILEDSAGAEYLPHSIRSKLLLNKHHLKDIYEDLGITMLTNAKVIETFVLPEFPLMPLHQKESVIQIILQSWPELGGNQEFISKLKETEFVKKRDTNGILFVRPDQLLDPRNDLLSHLFKSDEAVFPAEEFSEPRWLNILSTLGLKSDIDKDILLRCAWKVEEEQNVEGAIKLHRYLRENVSTFYDSSNNLSRQLSTIKFVPAEMGNKMELYYYKDVAVAQDRHLVYTVQPVMDDSFCPPNIMHSSLGITSPPLLSTVLKHIRELTFEGGKLDSWSYNHGDVETVFSAILSFLQESFESLDQSIKQKIKRVALVPVGTILVRPSKLFFRLQRNLAPFFYEVPRTFGAFDKLLRELGVRDFPVAEDYAYSLSELHREIGEGVLNANELHSCMEVLSLLVTDTSSLAIGSLRQIVVPDCKGSLKEVHSLVKNDSLQLMQKAEFFVGSTFHIVHPLINDVTCKSLLIPSLTSVLSEQLTTDFSPRSLSNHSEVDNINQLLTITSFVRIIQDMITKTAKAKVLEGLKIVTVEYLTTELVYSRGGSNVSTHVLPPGKSFCFLSDDGVMYLVRNLPIGFSTEYLVASTLGHHLGINDANVATLSSLLRTDYHNFDDSAILKEILVQKQNEEEIHRGIPGFEVIDADRQFLEIKPLKVYSKDEIVCIHNSKKELIYVKVLETVGGGGLTEVRLSTGPSNSECKVLSSNVYSFQNRRVFSKKSLTAPRLPTVESKLLSNTYGNEAVDLLMQVESSPTSKSINDGTIQDNRFILKTDQVLVAVNDLLRMADLSLEYDTETILKSNLHLKQELAQNKGQSDLIKDQQRLIEAELNTLEKSFLCPITHEIMVDPVICSDGHTYERGAIEQWLRLHWNSPKTNERLQSRNVIPNHAMRMAIEASKESMTSILKLRDDSWTS